MGVPGTTSPWLPMLRMIRVVRTLRIARILSGIRTLLFALMLSVPALFNVGSLLILIIYIYAILGMSQFNHIEKKAAITETLNFETFPNAFLLLFQVGDTVFKIISTRCFLNKLKLFLYSSTSEKKNYCISLNYFKLP